ncbi:MAG: hypothetical protein P8184_16990 [Calditrichia bacterium]
MKIEIFLLFVILFISVGIAQSRSDGIEILEKYILVDAVKSQKLNISLIEPADSQVLVERDMEGSHRVVPSAMSVVCRF